MDETELVVPWEKQNRIILGSNHSENTSPPRKCLSFSGFVDLSNEHESDNSTGCGVQLFVFKNSPKKLSLSSSMNKHVFDSTGGGPLKLSPSFCSRKSSKQVVARPENFIRFIRLRMDETELIVPWENQRKKSIGVHESPVKIRNRGVSNIKITCGTGLDPESADKDEDHCNIRSPSFSNSGGTFKQGVFERPFTEVMALAGSLIKSALSTRSETPPMNDALAYISQEEAQKIDEELFTEYAFSVDQLMELAGYSCAVAIQNAYPKSKMKASDGGVLVCCGPGNNGGDGLVCARHLKMFGYKPTIFYPRTPQKQLYKNLVTQCEKMGIAFLSYIPSDVSILESSYELVVDALFGFGFRPPMKTEFADVVHSIANLQSASLVCIDVPSGWEMTEKTTSEDLLQPDCLISLTAPKLCARRFNGRFHFLGGRFIPSVLADKYELNLPIFSGSSPIILLSGSQPMTPTTN